MPSYEEDLSEFTKRNAQVVGISCDCKFSNEAWAKSMGTLSFPLLSDFWPHGEVSRSYGVFNAREGLAIRGTFLIDAQGVVRWSVVNPTGQARDVDDYRAALAGILTQ
jgi:alkyl hydroperoxide reductase subunit AhpC